MRFLYLFILSSLLVGCSTADQKADAAYWNKDYQTAYAEFLPLAQQGDWLAEERIAYMYAHGQGRAVDIPQAQQWYEKAAMDGDTPIADSLGNDHMYPPQGAPNYALAAKWYQVAADRRDPYADLQMSILYEHGLGVAKDEDKATHYLNLYIAQTHVAGQKIQYKFQSGGDNSGGFTSAVQAVMRTAAQHSPDAKTFSYLPVYLSFHYQDGRAVDVKVVGSSGNPLADEAAMMLLQDTLLPAVLPSLSHDPNFTMSFALAQGMNGMYVVLPPSYQPAPPADALTTFKANLKSTITAETVDKLHEEARNQSGYVLAQFHYLDGKMTDADAVYQVGDKDLAQEVTQQLMQAQLPPPIQEIAGKRVRFLIAYCFMRSGDCAAYQKQALAAVKPEPDDPNE